MNKEEFLDLLRSPLTTNWQTALLSDYVIGSKKEAEAILRIAKVSQPEIQELILDYLEDIPIKLSSPVFHFLATSASDPSLRVRAIRLICKMKDKATTDILLLCSADEHPDPQEEAIFCLGSRSDSRVKELLHKLITEPDTNLGYTYSNQQERIRKASIIGLGENPTTSDVPILIDAGLRHQQHRDEIFEALRAVRKVMVANSLIDVILDGPTEEMPPPNQDFLNRALEVMHQLPPRTGKSHSRYVDFLCLQTERMLQPSQTLNQILIHQLTENFNDRIADCFHNRLITYAATPDQSTVEHIFRQIETVLAQVPLATSGKTWLKIINSEFDTLWKLGVSSLSNISTANEDALSELVATSIDEDRTAIYHKSNRLPEVVRSLGESIVEPLTIRIIPLLNPSDDEGNNIIFQYLRVCEKLIHSTEVYSRWLSHILKKYKDDTDLRVAIKEYLSATIDSAPRALRRIFITKLLEKPDPDLINLLKELVNSSSKSVEVLSDLLTVGTSSRIWRRSRSVLERSPSDSAARAAEVYLRTKWHPFIWSFLSSDFPYDAVNLGRELIDKEDYMMPTTSQAGVLHHLGKYGGEEDIGRLRSGLASTEPKIRSASVRALGDLGFSSIEESIWPLLEDPYTSVVQAAISALKQIAAPLAKTVTLLFERSGEDPNPETMDLAGQAIETLLRKHLNSDPFENVETWLTILTAFGRSDCATQLETILYELEDNPTLRAKVATTIGACCEPEAGLALITRRLNEEPVERNREVKYALNAAADQLSGSPDLAILRLISEVVEVELDRDELLGSYSFNQLFSIPNTVSYLRSGLPKVLKEKDNPDAFITRLDGISSILANEVEDALIRQYPSSATTNGRRRGFAAQIDFMGRVNPELKAAAVALHGIRQKSDLPHVEDETSGRPKPGCDAVDMEDAKRHFLVVFRETVKYLKQDYATHRSS